MCVCVKKLERPIFPGLRVINPPQRVKQRNEPNSSNLSRIH